MRVPVLASLRMRDVMRVYAARLVRQTAALGAAAAGVTLSACGSSASTPAAPTSGAVVLGAPVAYIGTTNVCVAQPANCLRAPATDGNFVSVRQVGNASAFVVSSADPAIASGSIVMRGPGGVGDPAVALSGHQAGTTTLTVSGADGATATLPITVTTVAALTVALNGLPGATDLTFTVRAPAGSPCPGFQGGYSFDWSVRSNPLTLLNFPAMDAGTQTQCLFSTVEIVVADAANTRLADKTFTLPLALGRDNSTTLTIP